MNRLKLRMHTFAALATTLLSVLALGCGKQTAPADGGPVKAASAEVAGSEEPRSAVLVQLGYQKIGAPFLLKSRSESLQKRLQSKSAKADWKEFKHGPALLEAINAKEVDVGYVGETPPVFAQAGNVQFVYVATDPPAPKAEAIVVLKDSPLKKVEDLKGKKVALNRGSNVHYLLLKALERAKLTVNDIEVVYLAPGDARPAFETGKVDAWVIWDPFLAAAEQSGARALTNGEGLVDNHLFYVVRREFAEKHPELVRDVLDEYRLLSEWESKNPEESAKLLAQSSGVAYEALLVAEKRHAYGLLPITNEVLAKQQAIADSFRKLGLIPKDIRTADAFLPSLTYAQKP
jgi:sulfonate transport system substrate-binding protein